MTDVSTSCDLHLDLVRSKFRHGLHFLTQGLYRQRKIKIVAIGSSSTAGESDIIPFPPRLELALRKRYPDRMIDVLNRGIGGQEAPEELSRFESDVIAEAPTLVIWQVGTNAIYHKELYDPYRVAGTIATGLGWLKALATDVILMDLQYASRLLKKKEDARLTRLMVSLISNVARTAEVNLFPRFELMELWQTQDKVDPKMLIGADGLHQTDFATHSVTQALDVAIGAATETIRVPPPPAA